MPHHSGSIENDFMTQQILLGLQVEKMADEAQKLSLGATGEFLEGKLVKHDEGELRYAVGVYEGEVVINFGTPVAFVAFPPAMARELAKSLVEHADSVGISGKLGEEGING